MAVLRPPLRRALSYTLVAVVAFAAGGLVTSTADQDGSAKGSDAAASPGVLDQAAAKIEADAEHPVSKAALEKAAVEGMLSVLDDRWSAYYPAQDYAAFSSALEGRYTGVGLWLRQAIDGEITVASVQPGSPAATAGVTAGDQLLLVGSQAVTGHGVAAAASALRGKSGTPVSVIVRSPAGDERSLTLVRTDVSSDSVTVERLSGGVLRIGIGSFTSGVGRQVRAALAAERGHRLSGVILDLRDDPGGLVDEAVEVAGAFLNGGPVVSLDRRDQGRTTLDASPGGDTRTPLVVLVDGGTASAAEIVTAALQDRGRAVVVGSRTYGKGSVQEPSRLADGSAIEITVGTYVTPAGRTIDGVGIEPDISVDPTASPRVAEARALEVLSGLVAAVGPAGRG
ncbi:MAG TPA: S41 family peptidase [Actinomycetes bacterium]|nr:S41 family peptidase [Actinomycetes bacterium]